MPILRPLLQDEESADTDKPKPAEAVKAPTLQRQKSFVPNMFDISSGGAINKQNQVPTVNVENLLESCGVASEPAKRGLGGKRLKAIKIPRKKPENPVIKLPFN